MFWCQRTRGLAISSSLLLMRLTASHAVDRTETLPALEAGHPARRPLKTTSIPAPAPTNTHPCPPRHPARSPCTFSSHRLSLRGVSGSAAAARATHSLAPWLIALPFAVGSSSLSPILALGTSSSAGGSLALSRGERGEAPGRGGGRGEIVERSERMSERSVGVAEVRLAVLAGVGAREAKVGAVCVLFGGEGVGPMCCRMNGWEAGGDAIALEEVGGGCGRGRGGRHQREVIRGRVTRDGRTESARCARTEEGLLRKADKRERA